MNLFFSFWIISPPPPADSRIDIDLHVVVLRVALKAPDLVDQGLLADDGAADAHEDAHEGELLLTQADLLVPVAEVAGGQIQLQLAKGELVHDHLPLPPGQGPHAGQELRHLEGFGQVVVRAAVQALHPIVDLGAGGEHEDGRVDLLLAKLFGDGEAVPLGEHDVENDEVIDARKAVIEAAFPVIADVAFEMYAFEHLAQGAGQWLVVLYDQCAHE